jgi:hypothetical protein
MKSDEHSADLRQSMLPIVFWTMLLAVLLVSSRIQRPAASDRSEDSQSTIDRLVRIDSVQFLSDFRAINS